MEQRSWGLGCSSTQLLALEERSEDWPHRTRHGDLIGPSIQSAFLIRLIGHRREGGESSRFVPFAEGQRGRVPAAPKSAPDTHRSLCVAPKKTPNSRSPQTAASPTQRQSSSAPFSPSLLKNQNNLKTTKPHEANWPKAWAANVPSSRAWIWASWS